MRTNEGIEFPTLREAIAQVAVVGEVRESIAVDRPEPVLDGALARIGVGTEPELVSGRDLRQRRDVIIGVVRMFLGSGSGGGNHPLVVRRAALVVTSLVVNTGDGKIARKLDLSNILNSCVEVFEGSVSVEVGEQVRRFDGIVSSAGSSEVVGIGHWW